MRVIDSGKKSALENMEEDFRLLQDPIPTLRFYEWETLSVTHGFFMKPDLLKNVERYGLQVAKRPTGGGLLFHQLDFTFSLILPEYEKSVLDSYRTINEKVIQAIHMTFGVDPQLSYEGDTSPRGGFCMAKPTIYDVMLNGKKIGGSAQRRTKFGLLHQASIHLQKLDPDVLEKFLPAEIVRTMDENSYALGFDDRNSLKENMKKVFIEH